MPETTVVSRTISTPVCPLRIAASPRGVTGVSFLTATASSLSVPGAEAAEEIADQAHTQLREYFDRSRQSFELPLDWSGIGGWRHTVLETLLASVAFGDTVGYRELATRAGQPHGARAVGRIMASNPIPVIVPCHRVVAADGGLGGFGGSGGAMVETKRQLLTFEGSRAPTLFDP